MKTAEQFLEECKERWKQSDPRMQGEDGAKQAMIEALILYAEQTIDMCADSVELVWETDYLGDEWKVVDRDSILNVKKQLK